MVALAVLAVGCQSTPHSTPVPPAADSLPASAPIVTTPRNWPDTKSHADPLSFVTRSFHLDLDVDFEKSQLRGTATLELDRVDPNSRELVLDTRDLQIDSVKTAPAGSDDFRTTRFVLDRRDAELGSALRIVMPRDAARVRIAYATSPQASGLQWLQPSQTVGQRSPFLFSQAQALHARSMAPLQDTPWIRATYTATLRVPAGLVAVMAAEGDAGNRRGQTTFHFRMPQPIPSYLLALAVGDLEFQSIGPRTGVWAEPAVLAAAAWEFGDAEAMMTQTEALYGPYRWGRYDVLVLPPSFPFGGMENPRLTFMTPTVIAGDKSLVWRTRARTRALVVGQPRDQCHVARRLAQRRLHHVFRTPDHGGGVRRGACPTGMGCRTAGAAPGTRGAGARRSLARRAGTRSIARIRGGGLCGCLREGRFVPVPARASIRACTA